MAPSPARPPSPFQTPSWRPRDHICRRTAAREARARAASVPGTRQANICPRTTSPAYPACSTSVRRRCSSCAKYEWAASTASRSALERRSRDGPVQPLRAERAAARDAAARSSPALGPRHSNTRDRTTVPPLFGAPGPGVCGHAPAPTGCGSAVPRPSAAMRRLRWRSSFFSLCARIPSRCPRLKAGYPGVKLPMSAGPRSSAELELELIQTHMTQKPVLLVEVGDCRFAQQTSTHISSAVLVQPQHWLSRTTARGDGAMRHLKQAPRILLVRVRVLGPGSRVALEVQRRVHQRQVVSSRAVGVPAQDGAGCGQRRPRRAGRRSSLTSGPLLRERQRAHTPAHEESG